MITEPTIVVAGVPHVVVRAAGTATGSVLLIPHFAGIDHFTTEFAHGLAARGLTTFVWNPYPELPIGTPVPDPRPPRPNDRATLRSLAACLDVMGSELGLPGVVTVGFCMGGRFALLFGAHEPRLRALVAAYPSLPTKLAPEQELDPLAYVGKIGCPVQVLYPGKDVVTERATFARLQALLEEREAETAIAVYPHAEHGFMHLPSPANDAAARIALPMLYGFIDAQLAARAPA